MVCSSGTSAWNSPMKMLKFCKGNKMKPTEPMYKVKNHNSDWNGCVMVLHECLYVVSQVWKLII